MIIKCVPWFALKSMNLSSIIVYWGFIKFAIKMTPNSTSKFKFSTNLWFILSLFSYRFSKSLNIMKFPYYCYHCYISSVNWFTNEPKIVTKCFKELIKFNICLEMRQEAIKGNIFSNQSFSPLQSVMIKCLRLVEGVPSHNKLHLGTGLVKT